MKRYRYRKIVCILLCLALIISGSVTGFADEPGPGQEPYAGEEPGSGVSHTPGNGQDQAEDPQPGEEPNPGENPQPGENPNPGEDPNPGENPNPGEDPQPGEGTDPEEEPVVRVATKISGVPKKLTKHASSKVTFTVTVKPANGGRVVKLQQYDSKKKKWRTRAKYETPDQDKAKVKVELARKYRKKTLGKWRVLVPVTDLAEKAVSRTCTVRTINVTTYSLAAKSACVYCIDDGKVLYTKKYKTKRLPASTTKLMTAILLAESGKLGGTTTVSAYAASTPWSYGRLVKGDKYRTRDLLYAVMLPSSNSAAVAVAETVSGSTSKFVKKMNAKAEEMGLDSTHFCNPHGIHQKGHYTTALDMAKLTAYAYGIEEISKPMRTSKRTIKSLRYKRVWTLYSTDVLLGKIKNFFGGKTGTSPEAKYCFTGVYKYKEKTYVTVVLNAGTAAGRWNDTKKLQSYICSYAESSY